MTWRIPTGATPRTGHERSSDLGPTPQAPRLAASLRSAHCAIQHIGNHVATITVTAGDGFGSGWSWTITIDKATTPAKFGHVGGRTGRERAVTAARDALGQLELGS